MARLFGALLLAGFLNGCSILASLPAMPLPGPITNTEQAIRIAINLCGGWRTAEEKSWDVRRGYQSWIAEYDGKRTYWSDDDTIHVKAIIDESTGRLLNCTNEAPTLISVTE